jgi:uncharacterized protein YhfF
MTDVKVEAYWDEFLKTQPHDSSYHGRSYIAEGFGDNPALADELAALVLSGVKTATCSALWEWEAEGNPIPEVGLLSITLSGAGDPICILETTEVTVRPYDEVDKDFARDEGEGDLSLAYWREAHKRFFTRILAKIGREFSEDMPLVCERFTVIYK